MSDLVLRAGVVAGTMAFSAALVPASRALARRWGALDAPGPRRIHAVPMPRLGGLAIWLSFTAMVLAGYFLAVDPPVLARVEGGLDGAAGMLHEARRVEAKLLALLAGASLAFGVGFADDIIGPSFSVALKAAGQVAAALVVIAAGIRTSFLPFEWMNMAVTLLWIVGITNSFNLLDNMDGLSAGVALVASGILLVNAWSLGESFTSLILLAFMGSLLGFLFFNFHPASVFLGDGGSHFIGYVLGSVTLLQTYLPETGSSLFPVLMPVVVLAVPLMDTATVIVIRVIERRPIYVGDSRHLSHRLLSLGFSQRAAALFIYLTTFCLGLGAVSLPHATEVQSFLILLQSAAFMALILILILFERRRQPRMPKP